MTDRSSPARSPRLRPSLLFSWLPDSEIETSNQTSNLKHLTANIAASAAFTSYFMLSCVSHRLTRMEKQREQRKSRQGISAPGGFSNLNL
jgi:hypothetical protein